MRRRLRGAALALAVGLLLSAAPTLPASAESTADAQAAAEQAAVQVEALQPRVQRALRAYQHALSGIAGAVSRSVAAEQLADAAAARAQTQRDQVETQVRALYMSGGSAGLVASVLTASTATDALRRVAYVQRLVASTSATVHDTTSAADDAATQAAALEAAADSRVVTAADVTRRYDQLTDALAAATEALTRLSDRARSMAAAETAAARIAQLNASVDASAAARISTARAMPIPADFKNWYVAAAKTCRGLSWTVVAAIGQVESGHRRTLATSYAGAQGPMQFLPATFAAYAVDGDHDGDTDILDPADAIFTAAHYLCANGGGRGAAGLHNAIWHYNHAEWYVTLVLKLAGQLADEAPHATIGD